SGDGTFLPRSGKPVYSRHPYSSPLSRHPYLVTQISVMRFETDGVAIFQVLQINVGALGLLVHGVLDLAVGLVGGADVEQLEIFLHFPLVRAGDASGRIDDGARAHRKLLAVEIAHGRMTRDHVIAGLDRVPMKLLVGAGLVGRAP